jgi:ABC-type branched-subunit amino acid transport system ATPase component
MTDQFSIHTEKLGRIYKLRGAKTGEAKSLGALKDIDLTVHRGELFGLLDPNGAGKTTLIKILTTLLSPTSGKAMVAGVDVEKHPDKVRQIGYIIPIIYWIELIRRSFIGNIAQAFPTFTQFSDLQLVLILLGTAVLFGVIGYFSFVLFDRRAKEKGFIDWSTSY